MRRILCGVWAVVLWGLSLAAGPVLYGPWTGAPDSTGVTVTWVSAPSPAVVQYGPLSLYRQSGELPFSISYVPQTSGDKEIVHVRLVDLAPSTWYVYRLVFPDGQKTPIATFRTAPEPGEPVNFAVISDTQWQWTGFNRVQMVAEAMACDPLSFHFVVHCGDLVETPIPSHWEFFFHSTSPVLRWAPLLPVLGNHERDSLSYYQHFSLPPGGGRLGKRWWTLHWGDVVVVGLDSNAKTPKDYQDQVEWARASLSGPEPYKIVIFHHPVFSSDAMYGPGLEGLQKLWHPVFVELGVELVLSGHAHNYERIEQDGVTYLVVGGGGATLRPLSSSRVEGSVFGDDSHYFYLAVRADENGLSVRVMRVAELRGGTIVPKLGVLEEFFLPKAGRSDRI